MKRLLLIRHAKSSWQYPELADRLRPLNPRGYRAVAQMGRQSIIQDNPPDCVLCSPAVRTYSTAQGLLQALDLSSDLIQLQDALYQATAEQLVVILQEQQQDTLWLVGHNPGLELLALGLGADIPAFPTLAVACFEFSRACLQSASLSEFLTPRELN